MLAVWVCTRKTLKTNIKMFSCFISVVVKWQILQRKKIKFPLMG
jgi:hypothetical protein